MNYKEALLRSKICDDVKKNKENKEISELVLTATTLNFLRITEKYNINLDDILSSLKEGDEDKDEDKCSMCGTNIQPPPHPK